MNITDQREQVYRMALRLYGAGLIRLSAGNVSLRGDDGLIAITPSGLWYEKMQPDDIVIIDPNGAVVDAKPGHKPSSEWALHTAILAALPQVNAVIHTHSIYALVFASLVKEIPAISIELIPAGGNIPVAPYAPAGTPEVGRGAAAVFQSRPGLKGLLLQNHGLVTIGETLDRAFEYALDIETAAQAYHLALQVGQPVTLTAEQIDDFHRYHG
ncbi:MAG: class II aldolase/adducin family protein [Anaerolineae bacterium]|nr:class II aldolase/adducin family protein [Anaerolineae bacterium]